MLPVVVAAGTCWVVEKTYLIVESTLSADVAESTLLAVVVGTCLVAVGVSLAGVQTCWLVAVAVCLIVVVGKASVVVGTCPAAIISL